MAGVGKLFLKDIISFIAISDYFLVLNVYKVYMET